MLGRATSGKDTRATERHLAAACCYLSTASASLISKGSLDDDALVVPGIEYVVPCTVNDADHSTVSPTLILVETFR